MDEVGLKNDVFPVILIFMKFCVAQTFFVECHLDAGLEVLQVVASKFLFMKIITIGRFTKKIRMIALLMTAILNFTTISE